MSCHGTRNRYLAGCRCDPCREANRTYQAQARADRRSLGLPAVDPRHGTRTGYQEWGCKCGPCTAAGTAGNAYYATPQPVSPACAGCARPMVPRRAAVPEGFVQHRGRGYCRPCARDHQGPARPPMPRLPVAPLLAAIAARGLRDNGHHESDWQIVTRAIRDGDLTVTCADKASIRLLGLHPCFIWGDAWWIPETEVAA